jgi:hypothetical protein
VNVYKDQNVTIARELSVSSSKLYSSYALLITAHRATLAGTVRNLKSELVILAAPKGK